VCDAGAAVVSTTRGSDGTDELAGITGSLDIRIDDVGGHTYVLGYDLGPARG
jgi:hypothetical protein